MVKIKRRGSFDYISKEYEGPIEELPFKKYIKDLNKWAKKKKAKPYGKPAAFYQYDFDKASDKNFRADIGIPIKERRKGGEGYKLKFLPPTKVAVKKFKGTPADYAEAYEEIYDYIEKKGYKPFGQRMEKFKKTPEKKGGVFQIKSELQVPVKETSKK
ncbi:MAG: GyrI-like domain-containing protein [Candidatus Thermoplasmatota archaeon]|nr:GyrI-like domain-containing protein [Candidatus Thermoplasmatota archaeon]